MSKKINKGMYERGGYIATKIQTKWMIGDYLFDTLKDAMDWIEEIIRWQSQQDKMTERL